MSSTTERPSPRFSHCCPGDVEDANDYCLGGLHPISIGECYSNDRYKVIHKLGFGATSTVWLARDQHQGRRLVALKTLRADESVSSNELAVQKHLQTVHPPIPNIQMMLDHFYVDGPNGTHLFLVYPFCGPNLYKYSISRVVDGTTRLRKDLAREIIRQLVVAVDGLHRAGVVHRNITSFELLFSLPSESHRWTDAEVYEVLGDINTIPIVTWGKNLPVPTPPCGVPSEFILPTDYRHIIERPAMLNESIVLGGFGQSCLVEDAIRAPTPRTLITYTAPETRFENRAGYEADVWQLGCAIYEIRTAEPLFNPNPIINDTETVLGEMVALLGRLPDPWWEQFAERRWFTEDGKPKYDENGEAEFEEETSIHELLTSIADDDPEPEYADINPMFEEIGVKLTEVEVERLEDLLEKMLRYKPEDRIKLTEVVQHPYLDMRE